jgi:type VI secretion system protein ImpE
MERLEVEPPQTLRDLIWARARVQTSKAFRLQDLGEVLIPVLSPFSSQNADDDVKLGRTTVWENVEGVEEEVPFGQRMIWIDGEEVPLLELRSLTWQKQPEDAGDAPE